MITFSRISVVYLFISIYCQSKISAQTAGARLQESAFNYKRPGQVDLLYNIEHQANNVITDILQSFSAKSNNITKTHANRHVKISKASNVRWPNRPTVTEAFKHFHPLTKGSLRRESAISREEVARSGFRTKFRIGTDSLNAESGGQVHINEQALKNNIPVSFRAKPRNASVNQNARTKTGVEHLYLIKTDNYTDALTSKESKNASSSAIKNNNSTIHGGRKTYFSDFRAGETAGLGHHQHISPKQSNFIPGKPNRMSFRKVIYDVKTLPPPKRSSMIDTANDKTQSIVKDATPSDSTVLLSGSTHGYNEMENTTISRIKSRMVATSTALNSHMTRILQNIFERLSKLRTINPQDFLLAVNRELKAAVIMMRLKSLTKSSISAVLGDNATHSVVHTTTGLGTEKVTSHGEQQQHRQSSKNSEEPMVGIELREPNRTGDKTTTFVAQSVLDLFADLASGLSTGEPSTSYNRNDLAREKESLNLKQRQNKNITSMNTPYTAQETVLPHIADSITEKTIANEEMLQPNQLNETLKTLFPDGSTDIRVNSETKSNMSGFIFINTAQDNVPEITTMANVVNTTGISPQTNSSTSLDKSQIRNEAIASVSNDSKVNLTDTRFLRVSKSLVDMFEKNTLNKNLQSNGLTLGFVPKASPEIISGQYNLADTINSTDNWLQLPVRIQKTTQLPTLPDVLLDQLNTPIARLIRTNSVCEGYQADPYYPSVYWKKVNQDWARYTCVFPRIVWNQHFCRCQLAGYCGDSAPVPGYPRLYANNQNGQWVLVPCPFNEVWKQDVCQCVADITATELPPELNRPDFGCDIILNVNFTQSRKDTSGYANDLILKPSNSSISALDSSVYLDGSSFLYTPGILLLDLRQPFELTVVFRPQSGVKRPMIIVSNRCDTLHSPTLAVRYTEAPNSFALTYKLIGNPQPSEVTCRTQSSQIYSIQVSFTTHLTLFVNGEHCTSSGEIIGDIEESGCALTFGGDEPSIMQRFAGNIYYIRITQNCF